MSIVRRRTTQNLSGDISQEAAGSQLRIQKHRHGYGGVYVRTRVATNQKNNKSQSTSDDQRIAVAGKDGQNEKEGAEVLCEV